MVSQNSALLLARASQRSWIASLTDHQIAEMSRMELLEVVLSYQFGSGGDRPQEDHRRFLSRPELERLVFLVRGQCQ